MPADNISQNILHWIAYGASSIRHVTHHFPEGGLLDCKYLGFYLFFFHRWANPKVRRSRAFSYPKKQPIGSTSGSSISSKVFVVDSTSDRLLPYYQIPSKLGEVVYLSVFKPKCHTQGQCVPMEDSMMTTAGAAVCCANGPPIQYQSHCRHGFDSKWEYYLHGMLQPLQYLPCLPL